MTSPGNRSFFKYAPPETVLAILKNKTVRYSSPVLFNDPFDVQGGLHFDFEIDGLHGKVLDRIHELASAAEHPKVDDQDVWGQIVLRARQHYITHGSHNDRWSQMFYRSLDPLVSSIKETQAAMKEHWAKHVLTIRMFCVSEQGDNPLMWAHYAKEHTGAVFEFLSLPEEDNPLSVARKVRYLDKPLPLFTEQELVDETLSLQRIDQADLYRRYVESKDSSWSYEREWRAWYPTAQISEALYEDMPIRDSEFAALILGCRVTASFSAEVIEITKSHFPNAKIFQAKRKEGEYSLEYVPR